MTWSIFLPQHVLFPISSILRGTAKPLLKINMKKYVREMECGKIDQLLHPNIYVYLYTMKFKPTKFSMDEYSFLQRKMNDKLLVNMNETLFPSFITLTSCKKFIFSK